MRKKNVSIWIATQNLSDIASREDLINTINDQCSNKIYLPNTNSISEQSRVLYRMFGCNDRQIEIISQMTPKQDYYYCNKDGNNRIFRLALQPAEIPFVTATAKSDQQAINRILAATGKDHFIEEWFAYKEFAQEGEKYKDYEAAH